MASARDEKLHEDHEALQVLKEGSEIFDFEASGAPPQHYTLVFQGQGIARPGASGGEAERIGVHRCQIRLPESYPDRPPDVRWLTPLFHPNVSFSGFISLPDIGLPWTAELGLDVLCERLWDVARGAYLDPGRPVNIAARNWFRDQHGVRLPVDDRPLRCGVVPRAANVITYRRPGTWTAPRPPLPSGELLYINDDTAAPEPPAHPRRRRRWGEDGVLYIGDD